MGHIRQEEILYNVHKLQKLANRPTLEDTFGSGKEVAKETRYHLNLYTHGVYLYTQREIGGRL